MYKFHDQMTYDSKHIFENVFRVLTLTMASQLLKLMEGIKI